MGIKRSNINDLVRHLSSSDSFGPFQGMQVFQSVSDKEPSFIDPRNLSQGILVHSLSEKERKTEV